MSDDPSRIPAILEAAEQAEKRERDRRNGPKLCCPACGHSISDVLPDKAAGRAFENGEDIYRRMRKCRECEAVFSSVERVEKLVRKQSAA